MTLSRRDFFLAGLGAVITGCTQTGRTVARHPGLAQTQGKQYPLLRRPVTPMPRDLDGPAPIRRVVEPPRVVPRPAPVRTPVETVSAISRSSWAKAAPIGGRLNPMGSYERITVHHEGWTRVWFSDYRSTAARLESIRKSHLDRLKAGDIGYHFVIDRAGRVWQGRLLQYQGAHVRDHNRGNIGVMVLGNFNNQHPTDVQMSALGQTLKSLMRRYRVPVHRVYTHQELIPTSCPGRSLQRSMVVLRKGRYLL